MKLNSRRWFQHCCFTFTAVQKQNITATTSGDQTNAAGHQTFVFNRKKHIRAKQWCQEVWRQGTLTLWNWKICNSLYRNHVFLTKRFIVVYVCSRWFSIVLRYNWQQPCILCTYVYLLLVKLKFTNTSKYNYL